MKHNAVIFDLFGTLVPLPAIDDETAMLSSVAAPLGVDRDLFKAYWLEHLPILEEDKLGSLANNFEHVCRTLGAPPLPARIAQAVGL